jgi:hypothetical protein
MKNVTVRLPKQLRTMIGIHDEIRCEAKSVGQALSVLVENFPQLQSEIYDTHGHLRSFVHISYNNEMISHDMCHKQPVAENDIITITSTSAPG